MSKSPSNFRQADVKRGLQALKTTGAAVKRVAAGLDIERLTSELRRSVNFEDSPAAEGKRTSTFAARQ